MVVVVTGKMSAESRYTQSICSSAMSLPNPGQNLLMMVVRMSPDPLRATPYWCDPARTVVVAALLRIQLSPSSPLSFGRSFGPSFGGLILRLVAFGQRCVDVLHHGGRGDGARQAADASHAAADARKHAAKLALNAWLRGGSRLLRLCSLNGLREWRNPTFAVDFLNGKQVALVNARAGRIVDASVSRCVKRMATAAGKWRGRKRRRHVIKRS